MSWLSKLFSKHSEQINVTSKKEKKRSNSTRSRTNRNRSGSLIMQRRMQKKIAESAKEVLDKRKDRKSQSVFDLKLDKDQSNYDAVDNARFDINKNEVLNSNLMIKEEYNSDDSKDEQSNSVNGLV